MAEQIILMRHGETRRDIFESDVGLLPKGIRQVENVVAQWMAAGIQIDCIRHSPRLRTTETALIAARKTGIELTNVAPHENLARHDGQSIVDIDIMPVLKSVDGTTLIVSHGPEILRFIGQLISGRLPVSIVDYADAIVIERNGDRWETQARHPDHKFKQVFSPPQDLT